ncbi:MAG: hypothetical protein IPH50_02905 [Rhodanobacteraceae bacterium]|nr:hypothetical protein [Rhodanobacteraceae bacterium]
MLGSIRSKWKFSTHQFRRKFANHAARSVFGDLRYLKEHFKHWSFDMTLGYALNESQEIALYAEIQDELDDIKEGVVERLQPNTPLAGGLGANLVAWRGNHDVTLFKSHAHMVRSLSESVAVRSNGHAWCTADQGHLCIGSGGLDRTRCTDCDHAVIGSIHARMYQGLYDQLKEVLDCNDIGEGAWPVCGVICRVAGTCFAHLGTIRRPRRHERKATFQRRARKAVAARHQPHNPWPGAYQGN